LALQGESLQGWAEALAATAAALPDALLTPAAEVATREQGLALFERAVQAYQQARPPAPLPQGTRALSS